MKYQDKLGRELLNANVITRITSPWSATTKFIPKKDPSKIKNELTTKTDEPEKEKNFRMVQLAYFEDADTSVGLRWNGGRAGRRFTTEKCDAALQVNVQ